MSWNDFWTGSGGISGEFAYGTTHLLSVLVLLVLTVVLSIWGAKKKGVQRKIIMGIAICQIIFEVFWRILYLSQGQNFADIYPFYPCNLAGILLPIAALTNNKIMKKIFYFFGFIGGVITFAMPEGIFSNAYLSFPILKSILQHTGLILLPVVEYVYGTFRPKLKDFGWMMLGVAINVVNSEGISLLLGRSGDYMFFRSGLPFVVSGIPQWITFSVFGAFSLFVLSCAIDILGTKAMLCKIFRRKNQVAKKD